MSDKYFQMVHAIWHLMNLCSLSSNGTMQKKQVLDPSPRLFKDKPNGSPSIMTLHMNTFAWNGIWECQPRCNIFHHLAFDLHTFHNFFALEDSQDTDGIAWWYNIFVVTCNKRVPSCNRQSTQGATFVFNGKSPCNNGISCSCHGKV